MTNCKNCGAPITNGKCEYCGTEYETTTETYYTDCGNIEISMNIPMPDNEALERLDKQLKKIERRLIQYDV